MTATAKSPVSLFVVGANHLSSPVGLRDQIFVDDASAPLMLDRLRRTGIAQAVILSTCDRVEIQGVAKDTDAAISAVRTMFAERAQADAQALIEQGDDPFYHMTGLAAVRQIFAVASSLDSQVIGEPQVLGQVKESHGLSRSHDMVGPELESVLQSAYNVAKRVRTDTVIGRRPVSIAAAAAQLARDVHGDLSRITVLVLGLGDMANIVADYLRDAGAGQMLLSGPSRRTEATARRQGRTYVAFDQLEAGLAQSDVVVSEAGTGRYLIPAEMMAAALKTRRRQPVLLIDVGAPPDIDPATQALDGAFLYALDDLESVAMQARQERGAAAKEAWEIVDDAVARWSRKSQGEAATPAIIALRSQFEATRQTVLAENPNAGAEEATRLLINRLLHAPSRAMRDAIEETPVDEQESKTMMDWVRRTFGGNAPDREG
ncbi:MAG: glutamyl-tRNA reductase [Alphaproteobacteria bacterium]|jgi:glutamyl-tRNA reductase